MPQLNIYADMCRFLRDVSFTVELMLNFKYLYLISRINSNKCRSENQRIELTTLCLGGYCNWSKASMARKPTIRQACSQKYAAVSTREGMATVFDQI